jgi:hypothetical protein
MFEVGSAVFTGLIAIGLLIAFKKLWSLQNRFDRLARDHDILANRMLLFRLNRVPEDPVAPTSLAPKADARSEVQEHPTEMRRRPIRSIDDAVVIPIVPASFSNEADGRSAS